MLTTTFTLLFTSGCFGGLDVGHDGQGGGSATNGPSTSSSTSSSGSGGQAPTGSMCTSPGALLCPWGEIGGPCGSGTGQSCTSGWVCVGEGPDVPGTCAVAGQTVSPPGGACGAAVPGTPVCTWDYTCDAPIAPDGVGNCVPKNCVLSAPAPLVSAASITIDGDGPTQHDDFACTAPFWSSQATGEANAYSTTVNSSIELVVVGCASSAGDVFQGSLEIVAPMTGVGTVPWALISYVPPPALMQESGNYLSDPISTTLTITEMSADRVSGSYDAVVTGGSPMDNRHITGTFEVCHLPYHPTF
jgi:hypothetical protein